MHGDTVVNTTEDDLGSEQWAVVMGVDVSSLGRIRRYGVAFHPRCHPGLYSDIIIDGRRHRLHNLVAMAFLPPAPTVSHTIDHIDRNIHNNHVSNLRWASKREQVQHRVMPKNKAGSKPIELDFGDGWIPCPSINEASRKYNLNLGSLSLALRGKARAVNGVVVRYQAQEGDDPNERWELVDGHRVSTLGRVEDARGHRYSPNPLAPHGYCIAFGAYVHALVMKAFGPEQPSEDHTIDHINRVRHDNRIVNLRWATKSEQVENQRKRKAYQPLGCAVKVKATFPDGSVKVYASTAEAQRATGIDSRRISEAFHGKAWNKNDPHVHRGSGIRFE